MASSASARDKSINLKDTEEDDNQGDDDNEEENELNDLREENRLSSVWKEGGTVKELVLWKLQKMFSSFVTKHEDEDTGEKTYETLLSAHKSVSRATKLLSDNDNHTTRDFTIHIANKQWIKTTLVPLMELGVKDRDLTMRCCRLLMVLTRYLNYDARKSLSLDVKSNKTAKETKEEATERFETQTIAKMNAQQQVAAFLSFKEAVCTENCSIAITNAFYHLWRSEKDERREREERRLSGTSNEFTKREIATCLSYVRRLLQIDAIPSCSQAGDFILAKNAHSKLIIQLRALLFIVPVICAELADKYNDVWLTDILRIIHSVLRSKDPKDFFKIWKENCLIGQDEDPDSKVLDLTESGENPSNGHTQIVKNDLSTDQDNLCLPKSFSTKSSGAASNGLLGIYMHIHSCVNTFT